MERTDTDKLSIAINSKVQDLVHSKSYIDLDEYGFRLSHEISDRVMSGGQMPDVVHEAIAKVMTRFFRLNKIERLSFVDDVLWSLRYLAVTHAPLMNTLLHFKAIVERQFTQPLLKNRSEEYIRSLLQMHLGRHRLTIREVESGRGSIDLMVFVNGQSEVIEMKVWDGQAYFDDGLLELARYLKTEQRPGGFYVVLEFGGAEELIAQHESDTWTELVDGRSIEVIFVRIPDTQPSKIGRELRRKKRVA